MTDVPSILMRAADKCGLVRVKWAEKNIPNNITNISIMLFFGDARSAYILSSMLLKRYREQVKGSKYFILCTWPGLEHLFPYVDEMWVVRDEAILRKFFSSACGFDNSDDMMVQMRRELNYWFEDVAGTEVFTSLYHNGLQQGFWDKFKNIRRYMISVPSANALGEDLNRKLVQKGGMKVFVYPNEHVRTWQRGKLVWEKCPKNFWVLLVKNLLAAHITPVVYYNFTTHNISTEVPECIYTTEKDVAKVFGIMRTVGCVLDVFSGISRWAIGARAPFVALDERNRYNGQKEYEIDDLLCDKNLPRQYIFSFPTIIKQGEEAWKTNFYDVLLSRLVPFVSSFDREKWPSPLEREEGVLYENVRERLQQKMGTRFIKVNRDLR